MLEAVLGGGFVLAGTLLGSVLERRATRSHTAAAGLAAHRQEVREAIAALVSALSAHRGDLYERWTLAHRPTATEAQTDQARHTSHASRRTVTHALYRLRVLTSDLELLRAATEAVGATYAVKAKGEALAGITEQDLAGRHCRATAADDVLLAACATRLAP